MKRLSLLLVLLSCLDLRAQVIIESPYNTVTNYTIVGIHLHSLIDPSPDPAGNHPLENICKFYGDTNNYGGYIITEHDQVSTNSIPPFAAGVFIQGQEITRLNQHVIGMWITNKVPGGYPSQSGTLQACLDAIVAQGGIAAVAHPNQTYIWSTNLLYSITNYQYMEVRNWGDGNNAEEKWDWILATGRRIWGYSALDTHAVYQTNNLNQVFLVNTNDAEIRTAITAGNLVFGWNYKMRVSSTNATIYAETYGFPSTFEWIALGPVTNKTTASATSDSYLCSGFEGYVRVRATQVGTTNIAYSQPLWISPSADVGNHGRTRKSFSARRR